MERRASVRPQTIEDRRRSRAPPLARVFSPRGGPPLVSPSVGRSFVRSPARRRRELCSRDPSPPPFEYVKGGGGIFKDMAVHDLDMARFLMGEEPVEILASGSCHIDKKILALPGPEAYDTANVRATTPAHPRARDIGGALRPAGQS